MWVYTGTTSAAGTAGEGIHVLRFDPATGELSPPQLAAEADRPSFLAFHPGGRFLYATRESSDGSAVAAFSIDVSTGRLKLLNHQPSGGRGACHVSVDGAGRNVLVANYGSGSVAVLPIGEDGRLQPPSSVVQHEGSGPHPKRQEGPHAHSINLDPAGRFALACDLGTDRIMVYRFDAGRGGLTPHDPPAAAVAAGAGPRHLAFGRDGRFAYVINELTSTVTAFGYDAARGVLSEVQTIGLLPEDFSGENTAAEVLVHPSGRFLYGSNRGHESIAIFAIDESTGLLTSRGHAGTQGRHPRNFGIDPTGRWLIAANMHSNTLVVFRIDDSDGGLAPTGATVQLAAPSCVRFLSP